MATDSEAATRFAKLVESLKSVAPAADKSKTDVLLQRDKGIDKGLMAVKISHKERNQRVLDPPKGSAEIDRGRREATRVLTARIVHGAGTAR